MAGTGGWSVEYDVRRGCWKAVKPQRLAMYETPEGYVPVSGVRLVRILDLPPGATWADAEAEVARMVARSVLK